MLITDLKVEKRALQNVKDSFQKWFVLLLKTRNNLLQIVWKQKRKNLVEHIDIIYVTILILLSKILTVHLGINIFIIGGKPIEFAGI